MAAEHEPGLERPSGPSIEHGPAGEPSREAPEHRVEVRQLPSEPEEPTAPPAPIAATSAPAAPSAPADPFVVSIESIMAEGLGDLYNTLDANQQQAFRQKGEETAKEIAGLLRTVKFQVQKVLTLLRGWLRLIPGVNEFFMEKEAKIKMDRLLALRDEQQRRAVQ